MKSISTPFCISLLWQSVAGWWDSGHALTMAVAWQELASENEWDVIEMVSTFLNVTRLDYPAWSDFMSSATYMDKIKNHTILYSNMHFKDIPFSSKGSETTLTGMTDKEVKAFVSNDTILGAPLAIGSGRKTLISSKGVLDDDYAPAHATDFALRLLVHVLGDIHQPLHSVGWYNDGFCNAKGVCGSDQGGNKVYLIQDGLNPPLSQTFKNLHMLWDSMCGVYTTNIEDLDEAYLLAEGNHLREVYPKTSMAKSFDTETYDPYTIMLESYKMAMTSYLDGKFKDGNAQRVYAMEYFDFEDPTKPTLNLTNEYIQWCQDAAAQRVTLAGYRLAAALKAFADSTPAAAVERAKRDTNTEHCSSVSHLTLPALATLALVNIFSSAN